MSKIKIIIIEKRESYTLVDLVHRRVRIVVCDLDDTAIPCHTNKTRPVGRPRDINHLEVVSDQK